MGQPILKYPLALQVDAGIRQEVIPGLVSEYECREAARYSNNSWTSWLSLDENERAMCVAHFRISNAITANVNDAHTRYQERMSRAGRRGK